MISFVTLILGFLLLLVAGVPVAYAMAISAVAVLAIVGGVSMDVTAAQMLNGINVWPLLAVPFFILAGNLMNRGGVTKHLIAAAQSVVGPVPGGLAHTAVVTNMIMAGMSGSDIADVTATGSVLIPALKRTGYPPAFAASLIAGAGAIGPLIPPSIAFILYGLVANVSIPRLFAAGAVPGVVLGLALMAMTLVLALRHGFPREPVLPPREIAVRWAIAAPSLFVPAVVIGGILGGVFTPTEAAAIAVACAFVVGVFIYRELRLRDIPAIVLESAKFSAEILIIVAAASLFGLVLALYNVGPTLAQAMMGIAPNATVLLLMINIGFLLLGMVFDTTAAIVLIVPILMPSVIAFGIDPVHFGVVVLLNLLIGLVTPPYGLAMYIVCRIAGISIGEFSKNMWPVLITMISVLLLLTYVPSLSLALPDALHIR